MKIEKISDKQIRCTLTLADLTDFNVKLTDLSYGSDKARLLFRDMMSKAHREYGFEADNVPLMIEAIPGSNDTLILIITKVDDPEELDTRFSKFTPDTREAQGTPEVNLSGADDIIDMFRKSQDTRIPAPKATTSSESETPKVPTDLIRLFTFKTLDNVLEALRGLSGSYDGANALYHSRKTNNYLLAIHKSGLSPEAFNKVCNILSEYSRMSDCTAAAEAHLREHEDVVIAKRALQQLKELI